MNKSLLALAVLGAFAGAASAQSSVTIYGLLDLGITKSNGGTAGNNGGASGNLPTATSPTNTYKAWTLQHASTSRLGFRGNEDLGGGLSAQFQIEHRFNPDTGTQNSAPIFWNGRSYVQLSSASAGRVYLGRDYSPAFWTALKADPFGWDGVGQSGLDMWAGFRTPAFSQNGSNVRTANTIGYKSPSLGGLTAQVAVALGEGIVGRDTGFNLEYAAGPIYAGLAYEKVNKSGTASAADYAGNPGSRDGNSLVNLSASYDFGVVKPLFYYARSKTGINSVNSNRYYSVALLAPVGGGTVKAAYGRLDPAGANNNQSKFGLGYDYALSKRTNVYADLGLTRADTKTNNSTYSFGVKHTF